MKFFRSAFALIFSFAFLPAFAQLNKFNIPDSSEIRAQIEESWFSLDLSALRQKRTENRSNSAGQNFQVRMEENDDCFFVIVAPEAFISVDFYTESGVKTEVVSEYPKDAAGSWILTRDSRSGKNISVKFYFAADSDVYVQFSPSKDGRKSTADFLIGGKFAARGVPAGADFEYFYSASFSDIVRLTQKSLPWKYAEIYPGQSSENLKMISSIRKNLPRVKYEWDACYDENGNPVRISDGKPREISEDDRKSGALTLSEAGFVKWIADALIEPQAGSSTFINPLLRPTTSANPVGYAGIKSQKENLSFTLDWTRNLAAARLSIQTRKNYLYEDSGVDVDIDPFSAELGSNGVSALSGYIKNTGYEIKNLKSILYVLAASDPTYFYFAAIRRKVAPSGGKPEYYVFDKAAAIFPFFDSERHFGCVIFDSGEELTLSQFVKKYSGCYINLSRVLASDRFFLN